jgi:hypothetical protein
MASQESFEKHRKLLLYIAHRVQRRCHAAGAKTVQLDDIFQELTIAWCLARDKWEPEITLKDGSKAHIPFGAYLMRGMSRHINRWAKYELRQWEMAPFELDAEIEGDGTGDGTLHDVLADQTKLGPEEIMIKKDLREYARDPLRWKRKLRTHKPLTANTEKFLDLMDDPPARIMAIVQGLQARAAYGRNVLKIPSTFAPRRITGSLVLDIMGVDDRKERAEIYNQIELLSDRVSQQ